MKSKYKDSKQVVAALKAEVERIEKSLDKTRRDMREYKVSIPYPFLNYRTFAGPFKVRDCEFRTNRFWFDPTTLEARSYGWWAMLKVIKGKLVRNACGYSMQTAVHQEILDKALKALKIEPDIVVYTRANIGNIDAWKSELLSHYGEAYTRAKYARKDKSLGHKQWLKRAEAELKKHEAYGVGLKFTQADKDAAIERAEKHRRSDLDWKKRKRELAKERERARMVVNKLVVVGDE